MNDLGRRMGVRLAQFVLGKRVVPSVPAGQRIVVSGAPEPVGSARRGRISGFGLFVEYQDSKGDRSARRIACRSYDQGHQALNAWCFERRAPRQFRLDRIISAACTQTGEMFEIEELRRVLADNQVPLDDARLRHTITVLTFLMHCDGMVEAERLVVLDAVERFALRFDGNDDLVLQGRRIAATDAPDDKDFLRSLRWISRRRDGPELARFVRSQAQSVIDADGSMSKEELQFGLELGDALTRIIERD